MRNYFVLRTIGRNIVPLLTQYNKTTAMAKKPPRTELTEIMTVLKRIEKKVDTQAGFDKDHLSIAETAKYLACNRGMVYQLTKAGKLIQVKIGKRAYYPTSQVKALFESKEIAAPTQDLNGDAQK